MPGRIEGGNDESGWHFLHNIMPNQEGSMITELNEDKSVKEKVSVYTSEDDATTLVSSIVYDFETGETLTSPRAFLRLGSEPFKTKIYVDGLSRTIDVRIKHHDKF